MHRLPENEFAAQVMTRMADKDALAPDLLQQEIRSILLSAERRGRIDDDLVYTALSRFRELALQLISRNDDAEVVRVARRYQLSAYDAAYLALALLENAPLVTLHRKLASAARSEGVPLLGPLSHEQ